MATPTDPIGTVLSDGYKKPFMLLVAAVAVATLVLLGLSKAESFVDGRVELKLATQRQVTQDQEKRLQRIEDQFASMKDTLAEIRADVRVLRERVEGGNRAAPLTATQSGERR